MSWVSTFPGFSQVMTTVKRIFGGIVRTGHTPRHIGVIMDGNRRYARSHNIELREGHNMGFQSMATILELLYESGVEVVTVYAFSIENFRRLQYEIDWLMDLAKNKLLQLCQHGDLCDQYGIRIRIIGKKDLLPKDVQEILAQTEELTKNNTRATLNVCFPYTSREEMTQAIQKTVAQQLQNGHSETEITEETIEGNLYTGGCPPLDILVRTLGTYRLSDFLLWQTVPLTCSIIFVNKLWPDFSTWDMVKILVNWEFNMYWYGHGNGSVTDVLGVMTADFNELASDVTVGGKSSVFERYQEYSDSMDEGENQDEYEK